MCSVARAADSTHEGRPADGAREDPEPGQRDVVQVRAGLGIVGDRYYGRAAHRTAAVTVFDAAALDEVAAALELDDVPDAGLTRRNIVIRGFPVDTLAARRHRDGTRTPGSVFSLDSGAGPVRLRAHRPANPCAWMEVMLAPQVSTREWQGTL